MSNYGDLACLWLDSNLDPFEWMDVNPATKKPYADEILAMARAKQPNMVIWGGAQPDLTSCSHYEDGIAPIHYGMCSSRAKWSLVMGRH